jgi:membrane protein
LPLAAASTRNGTLLDALSERLKQLADNGPFDEDTRLGRWWAVAVHTARDLYRGNVLDWAASMAFYSVLSLFPLILIGLILLSFVTEPEGLSERAVDFLGAFLPGGEDQIGAIVDDAVAFRTRVGVLSALTFTYTGRRVLGSLVKGLNHVSDVDPIEDDAKRAALVEISLFAGLLGLAGLAMVSRQLVDALWEVLWAIPGPDELMYRITTTTVRAVFLFGLFVLVFAAVPKGERRWRAVATGALASTVAFLIAQGIFRLMLGDVWQNMSLAYGQLALAALLMTWAWIVALITLAGGGLASHVKVMWLEDAGAGESAERHVRS